LSWQWLSESQVPHSAGVPQPVSISPHWAPTETQVFGVQHEPNLSFGFARTQRLLAQDLSTLQKAPPGLPPLAALTSARARTAKRARATGINRFMEPLFLAGGTRAFAADSPRTGLMLLFFTYRTARQGDALLIRRDSHNFVPTAERRLSSRFPDPGSHRLWESSRPPSTGGRGPAKVVPEKREPRAKTANEGALSMTRKLSLVLSVALGAIAPALPAFANSALPQATVSTGGLAGGADLSDGLTPAQGGAEGGFTYSGEAGSGTQTTIVDFTLPAGVTVATGCDVGAGTLCIEFGSNCQPSVAPPALPVTVSGNTIEFRLACAIGQGVEWDALLASLISTPGNFNESVQFKTTILKRTPKGATTMWQIKSPTSFTVSAP
jgi:hypothetical protein